MKSRLSAVLLLLVVCTAAGAKTSSCDFQAVASGPQRFGGWVDKGNWLDVEYHRVTLQAGGIFMPSRRLPASGTPFVAAPRALLLERLEMADPLDGSRRDLAFMLDSRLRADGVVVLRNGRLVAERYRNGLRPEQPRLLLQAGRPLLNLLGAISVAQGKLAADKSVGRVLPSLNGVAGLRKLSVQRLLESEERHAWTAEELAAWRQAGGWTSKSATDGIRPWLARTEGWDKPLAEQVVPGLAGSPEDDLLAWVLAESNGLPLAQLFCEQLLSRSQPEHPVHWLSDTQGVELAEGLALSLRDFSRLGQLLVETRISRNRSRIPGWFIETLTASSGLRSPEIRGLAKGSEQRYGFIHLGGAPNRVALLGSHGTSLYVDFDQRLVIALYATYPVARSPALLATLEQFWKTVGQAGAAPPKR